MRSLVFLLTPLLLAGCDVIQELAQGSAPEHVYAQAVPLDTAGVVARRLLTEVPGGFTNTADVRMLPGGTEALAIEWDMGDLVHINLETKQVRNLTNNSAPAYVDYVSPSPDGRRAAYTWQDDKTELRVLDLAGGEPRTVHEADLWVESRGWSPDGQRIAVAVRKADRTWEIAIVPADGGEARLVRTLDWRAPGGVEFSPDGRFLVYDHQPDPDGHDGQISIIDLTSNREHSLAGSGADDRLIGWIPGTNQILFSSNRSGTRGLWALAVNEGRASGEPVLVRPDFWRSEAIGGISADGRLYYRVQVAAREAVTAKLDLAGGVLGTPEPLLSDPVALAMVPLASWSSDGRSVAIRTRTEAGRPVSIVVRSMATGESREYALPVRVGNLDALRWAPDGGTLFMIGYSVGTPSLMRLNLGSGRFDVFDVPVQQGDVFNGFDVFPDGRSIVVRRRTPAVSAQDENTATLSVLDLESGNERQLYQGRGRALAFAVSPDGEDVAVVQTMAPIGPPTDTSSIQPGTTEMLLVSASGVGQPRKLTVPGLSWVRSYQVLVWEPSGRALHWLTPNPGDRWGPQNSSYTLMRIPVDGTPPTRATVAFREGSQPPTGQLPPQLSPNGDRITYVVGNPAHELWVLEGLPGQRSASVRR